MFWNLSFNKPAISFVDWDVSVSCRLINPYFSSSVNGVDLIRRLYFSSLITPIWCHQFHCPCILLRISGLIGYTLPFVPFIFDNTNTLLLIILSSFTYAWGYMWSMSYSFEPDISFSSSIGIPLYAHFPNCIKYKNRCSPCRRLSTRSPIDSNCCFKSRTSSSLHLA